MRKVPLPLPSSTLTLLLTALTTTRSGLPSRLKSPTATEWGLSATPRVVAGPNWGGAAAAGVKGLADWFGLVATLMRVALVARPAKVGAGRHDVDLFPGAPANVANVERPVCRPQTEAKRIPHTIRPDLRAVDVGIAAPEGIGLQARAIGVDVQQLAGQRVEVLGPQGIVRDGVPTGSIAGA